MIPVIYGPLSVLPHSADGWIHKPRLGSLRRVLRNMQPVVYPVMLLACGVVIANASPPMTTTPISMSPVVVLAPTLSEHRLALRRDTIARMLTRKSVDSATAVKWAHDFVVYGAQAHVNPKLLVAIAYAESEFNPHALSSAGAIGLMQILPEPDWWHEYEPRCGRMTPASLNEPQVNICFGAHIFAEFLARHHGDSATALAAYNNGTGKMNGYPSRVYSSLAALKR